MEISINLSLIMRIYAGGLDNVQFTLLYYYLMFNAKF